MRILKWIVGIVAVLAIVFVVGGFLLPREVEVSRSVEIDAPAADIFPHVNSLKATQAWSPWLERDPATEVTFEGPEAGVGAKMAWHSDHRQVGSGAQEIVASAENAQVDTALDFGDMGAAMAQIRLAENGDGTTVTWAFTTDMGFGPMGRWMGLMMDGLVGADYEAGLARLKALVEG